MNTENHDKTKAQMAEYMTRYNKWQLAGLFLLGLFLFPVVVVKKLLGR